MTGMSWRARFAAREIRNAGEQRAQLREQRQAVGTHGRIFIHHHDLIEEAVDDFARTSRWIEGADGLVDRIAGPGCLAPERNAATLARPRAKMILGYRGGNDINLAMERGEVQGRCGWSWTSVKSSGSDIATVSRFFSRLTAIQARLSEISLGMRTTAVGSGTFSPRFK